MGGDETSYRAFKKEWNYVVQVMKVKKIIQVKLFNAMPNWKGKG